MFYSLNSPIVLHRKCKNEFLAKRSLPDKGYFFSFFKKKIKKPITFFKLI